MCHLFHSDDFLKQSLHNVGIRISVMLMEHHEFTNKLKGMYDSLPPKLRLAACYILDNPEDVALHSMRELARQAGVTPATMTRLAQALELSGFDEVRALHADVLRASPEVYAGRAEELVAKHRSVGMGGVIAEMITAIMDNLSCLGQASAMQTLEQAAREISQARRVYCLGYRASFPVAFQFAYLMALFDDKCTLIDPAGSGGRLPSTMDMTSDDILLAISYQPSAREVVEATAYARRRGVRVIAITDSAASPVGRMAHRSLLISSASPLFFDLMAPAFALCEILVALVAGLKEGDVPAAIAHWEAMTRDLGVWWDSDRPLPPLTPIDEVEPPAQSQAQLQNPNTLEGGSNDD